MRTCQRGFSLMELLISIAIIVIITAIAAPAFLQARRSANESSAVASLRALASAELTYASRNNQQYGRAADLVTPGYVDNRFGTMDRPINGYLFAESNNVGSIVPQIDGEDIPTDPPNGFVFSARPQSATQGRYNFAVFSDGVVRYGDRFPSGSGAGRPIGQAGN